MSQPNDLDIFNADDFQSIQINIRMANETSSTQVMKDGRSFGSEIVEVLGDNIKFLEFTENGMALQICRRSCETGHILDLDIEVTGIKIELRFSVKARVSELEHLDETWDQVRVSLTGFEDHMWTAFKGIFQTRQQEIANFMLRAKG
jgi:hypothetical protein